MQNLMINRFGKRECLPDLNQILSVVVKKKVVAALRNFGPVAGLIQRYD
jgi:hypothetical protein